MEQEQKQEKSIEITPAKKEKKSIDLRGIIIALILGASLIVCVMILAQSILTYKGTGRSEGTASRSRAARCRR